MVSITTAKRLHPGRFLTVFVLTWLVFLVGGCEQSQSSDHLETPTAGSTPRPIAEQPTEVARESPLLLEEEPLLLLDDEEPEAETAGADNSRCFVCHANYLDETIADESWASGGNGTAPDIMYPMDKIVPACMECHPKDSIDTPEHEPVFVQSMEKKVCTDCHGNHRLPVRRCKWK